MTEPRYLLDTNILIYLIGKTPPELAARVQMVEEYLSTSALCVAEALAGDRPAKEAEALLDLIQIVRPLAFDEASAMTFAAIPYKRRRIDRFIAAQALSRNLVVVTNNESDFADVPGLRVENWTLAG